MLQDMSGLSLKIGKCPLLNLIEYDQLIILLIADISHLGLNPFTFSKIKPNSINLSSINK